MARLTVRGEAGEICVWMYTERLRWRDGGNFGLRREKVQMCSSSEKRSPRTTSSLAEIITKTLLPCHIMKKQEPGWKCTQRQGR